MISIQMIRKTRTLWNQSLKRAEANFSLNARALKSWVEEAGINHQKDGVVQVPKGEPAEAGILDGQVEVEDHEEPAGVVTLEDQVEVENQGDQVEVVNPANQVGVEIHEGQVQDKGPEEATKAEIPEVREVEVLEEKVGVELMMKTSEIPAGTQVENHLLGGVVVLQAEEVDLKAQEVKRVLEVRMIDLLRVQGELEAVLHKLEAMEIDALRVTLEVEEAKALCKSLQEAKALKMADNRTHETT